MNFSLILEVTCGLLFLINKIALLVLPVDKRGWIWVPIIPAGFIALWMFLGNKPKLWALAILQIVGLGLSLRAMVAPNNRSKKLEKIVPVSVIPIMFFVLFYTYQSGVSVIDGFTAVLFTIGTMLFGYETLIKRQLAWFCYLVGHGLGAYLAYLQGFHFFFWTQIASAVVAYVGVFSTQVRYAVIFSKKHFPDDQ